MSTRLTDKQKWDDKWYKRLNIHEKMLFEWLCDHCEIDGFIKDLDLETIETDLGITEEDILNALQTLSRVYRGSTKTLVRVQGESENSLPSGFGLLRM